jgi:threonine dehydratase
METIKTVILDTSVSVEDIASAHTRISPYINETNLYRAEWLEKHLNLDHPVYLKLENEQVTGSFKPRGAFNALLLLSDQEKDNGVITRSSGNFAQAVSYASNQLGIKATVVMPTTTPQAKVHGSKKHGATVIQFGTTHKEGTEKVASLVNEKGYTPLHPFDSLPVIAGQGTIGLEIAKSLSSIGTLICPVGGGGLLGGISIALKHIFPSVQIIAAEPIQANAFLNSFQKKELQEIDTPKSIADGLLAPKVGDHNWEILKNTVDKAVSVSEDNILDAMRLIADNMKGMSIEPSGAVSIAALISLSKTDHKITGPLVCVVSGGNVDKNKFPQIFSKL